MNRGGNKTGKGDEIDAPINERKKRMSIERKKEKQGSHSMRLLSYAGCGAFPFAIKRPVPESLTGEMAIPPLLHRF